jgi:hypothetical protein
MNKSQPILTYTLSFLILAVLFKIIGLLNVNNEEILAYTFVFYGISSVYSSLGKNKKFRLFLGTVVFLIGIIFFVINNFDIVNLSRMIFPAIILTAGIGFLMLYIDNTNDKTILYVSAAFILPGLFYSIYFGTMKPGLFINSIYQIILKYWIIVIITAIIFTAINRDEKSKT